jgi:hypothetical protein
VRGDLILASHFVGCIATTELAWLIPRNDGMSEDQGDHQWRMSLASGFAWVLGVLVSFWVFIGAMYGLVRLDSWAFGNRPDRSGDFFLYLCVSGLIVIISARIVAWLARPNKADGMSLFSGSTGRLARFATIAVVIVGVWIVAIVVATKF